MPHNPATWARRIAFGMDVSKPGVELHHYICAGYYSCTETGFGEMIRPRMHVWVCMSSAYDPGVSSDRRATAYEPMLITHIECTADGLGIQIFGRAMLNWPRLRRYEGSHKAPAALKKDPSLYVYTDWEIVARADSQEGFVGVCIGPPANRRRRHQISPTRAKMHDRLHRLHGGVRLSKPATGRGCIDRARAHVCICCVCEQITKVEVGDEESLVCREFIGRWLQRLSTYPLPQTPWRSQQASESS